MCKKRDTSDEQTIFFATDLHGSNVCFKKFINAGKFYGAGVLVLGGDVTGKMVVPISRQADGSYLSSSAGRDATLRSEEEVAAFETRIADTGFYPKVMSEAAFQ